MTLCETTENCYTRLGHKQTFHGAMAMSALRQKQTCGAHKPMPLSANSGHRRWLTLISPFTSRFDFSHYIVKIETRWLLSRWELLEAFKPSCSERLQRHLNEGAICQPFVV